MLIFFLYNLALLVLSPLVAAYVLWQLATTDRSLRGLGERFGFVPRRKTLGDGPRVWIHAACVGETMAAKPIWEALLPLLPGWQLVHTTTTRQGQEQARKAVGDRGMVFYFPLDFLPCVWLAFARIRPRVVVLVETELWPNFLMMARVMGCRVIVVNGRLSERSLRGAARAPFLYRWMTANVTRFCMQSPEDAARMLRLGADPDRVVVTGNTKFDQTHTAVSLGERVTLRDALRLGRDEPVLLAGSTHPGEEEIVLRAFRQVRLSRPDARLVIAPRNTHRAQSIEELIVAHGFTAARRTKLANAPAMPDAVLILDTVGELARAYGLCTAAFVGGSLAPVGGHNILEPLALGTPALFGPHMVNFRDIAAISLEAQAGVQVQDAEELAARWLTFLNDPGLQAAVAERAAHVFAQHRGASARSAREIARLADTAHVPSIE
jgi:3-deoxy-D-manno-octulosonic-acid transferase